MANIVTISGMFGNGKTYFVGSPVIIEIQGLAWPPTSPFKVVHLEVVCDGIIVGNLRTDTYGQTSISSDISSALRAIWSEYDFNDEVAAAGSVLNGTVSQTWQRTMREYALRIYTEYISDGVFTTTMCEDDNGNTLIPGGRCLIGGMTEWERSLITDDSHRDVSVLEHTGLRYGDASTKPTSSPEKVGLNSITSWVDVNTSGTQSIFYPATYNNGNGENDDVADRDGGWTGHAPIVLRDSVEYTDFLFVNRRGAVETCSALMKEAMEINVATTQFSRVERPAFAPTRTLITISKEGRRSWAMSSGHVTREWAEWWAMEFLMAHRHWMRYNGRFVPVTVEPTQKQTSIYDRTKQQMPHVDFTVTLALEG